VNVVSEQLEAYRKPRGEAFLEQETLTRGDRITSAILREPVEVADLLP
jgi:hypothetical protein